MIRNVKQERDHSLIRSGALRYINAIMKLWNYEIIWHVKHLCKWKNETAIVNTSENSYHSEKSLEIFYSISVTAKPIFIKFMEITANYKNYVYTKNQVSTV